MADKKLFGYIQEIKQKLEELEVLQKNYTKEETLVAFRGEPRDYGETKLVPSIFRNAQMIEKESYIFELMSDYGLLDFAKTRSVDKAIESQHFVAISRMLDITFSILPALYFACGNEDDIDENGTFYVFCFPEHYSPHSAYLESFYNNVLDDKGNITYFKNFKVITHSYSNERIEAQSGGFIFFPGKEYAPIDSIYYKEIPIKAEDKKEILLDLKKLFNVEEATLFPEKSTRAKLIKNILYNETYSKREVTIENEISTCFERIMFEIELHKRKADLDSKMILRRLRKEKDDLCTYVKILEREKKALYEKGRLQQEESEKGLLKYLEDIDEKFSLLEKIY